MDRPMIGDYSMNRILRNNFTIIAVISLIWIKYLFIGAVAMAVEEVTEDYQPSTFVTIRGKTKDYVITLNGRFYITMQTKIFDSLGREIQIHKLPVPCNAKIRYETLNNGDSEALKIFVNDVFPSATTQWIIPLPE
jgi:hypothetical protein